VTPQLLSIQIGTPKTYTDEQGTWETAFYKKAVSGPIFLGALGLEGDAVANTKHHGGPDQAVLLYGADHYTDWQKELGREFPCGGFGENLTVSEMDETTVCIGDIYQIGAVKLQVTYSRIPCWKIARRWGIPDLTKRVSQSSRMGWYCRVLQEGEIEAGLSVDLLEQPNLEQTVAKAYRDYLEQKAA
jgi:MOSC domain-containing protein YiiM